MKGPVATSFPGLGREDERPWERGWVLSLSCRCLGFLQTGVSCHDIVYFDIKFLGSGRHKGVMFH